MLALREEDYTMTFKKTSILFILTIALCFFVMPIIIPLNIANKIVKAEKTTHLPVGYSNIQTYNYDDRGYNGERTIYWAEGIQGPKMDSMVSGNLNTPGYFERSVTDDFIEYDYPMETGKGYYDMNKAVGTKNSYCYLAASANLIHWRLDQNSEYIDRYIEMIADDTFTSIQELRNISSLTKDVWENMRSELQLRDDSGVMSQPLLDDYMVNNFLYPLIERKGGFWPDRVLDFYFNGYRYAHTDIGSGVNTTDNYTPDSRGGIFHAIFGKELLTNRMTSIQYEDYKQLFAQAFATGHGIALEISPVGGASTHAITIWGAEYDDRGELTALYLTDSDDYYGMRDNIAYGMRRRAIVNEDGRIWMNNGTKGKGFMVLSLSILSLGKDLWEEALVDTTKPEGAVIIEDIEDQHYSLESTYLSDIVVTTDKPKRGYYTYEWYESDGEFDKSILIPNANTNRLKLDSSLLGREQTKYYYVKINHIKNGKITSTQSRMAKVDINAKYLDAKKPKLTTASQNNVIKRVYRNQYIAPFTVNATSIDSGSISYQWSMKIGGNSTDAAKGATPIEGANTNTYQPDTNNSRPTTYYFCRVTNTKSDATGQKSTYVDSGIKTVKIETLSNALVPSIFENPISASYDYNALSTPLYVRAKSNDGGLISYQWYMAENEYSDGVKIGTNSNELTIDTPVSGTFYYYVIVTNTHDYAENIKTATATSTRAKVTVGVNTIPEPELPSPILSNNNYLSSITIDNYILSPVFDKNILEYNIIVPNKVTSVSILAITEHEKAHYIVLGGTQLAVGNNEATILVTAENGCTKTYTIMIKREALPEPPTPEPEIPELDTPEVPDGGDNGDNNSDCVTPETKPNTDNKPVDTPNANKDAGLSTTAKALIGVFVPLSAISIAVLLFMLFKRK